MGMCKLGLVSVDKHDSACERLPFCCQSKLTIYPCCCIEVSLNQGLCELIISGILLDRLRLHLQDQKVSNQSDILAVILFDLF